MDIDRVVFEDLFAGSDDPWGFRTRWYESRKRALTLACLPAARYARAFEPGCANGELTAALATRCDQVLASDGVAAAVLLAQQRMSGLGLTNVSVAQAWVPQDWPAQTFDLIVFSEFGFYLTRPALSALIAKARTSLGTSGTLLACHWRHPVAGFELDGDTVHRALQAELALPRLVHHEELDLVLDVWCADPRSVAQREGFA